MGIQDLKQFLRKRGLIKNVPIDTFRNKRIAIDASGWIYQNMYVRIKERLKYCDDPNMEIDRDLVMDDFFEYAVEYIDRFLKNRIIPVFVFDGAPPKLKEGVINKRAGEREKLRNRISKLKAIPENERDIEELRKLVCRDISTTPEEKNKIKEFLSEMGVPCLTSKTEAEKLCTSLCVEGKCYATLSSDTDNLPLSCRSVIFSIKEGECEICHLSDVLVNLDFSMEQFVDFCIMCGCDYNKRIKGIGIKRSFDLLTRYGSIEELPEKFSGKELDLSNLNYVQCRKLFSVEKSQDICQEDISVDYKTKENFDYFAKYDLDDRVRWASEKVDFDVEEIVMPNIITKLVIEVDGNTRDTF